MHISGRGSVQRFSAGTVSFGGGGSCAQLVDAIPPAAHQTITHVTRTARIVSNDITSLPCERRGDATTNGRPYQFALNFAASAMHREAPAYSEGAPDADSASRRDN